MGYLNRLVERFWRLIFTVQKKINADVGRYEVEETDGSGKISLNIDIDGNWDTIATITADKKGLIYFMEWSLSDAAALIEIREAGATVRYSSTQDVANSPHARGTGEKPIYEFAAGALDVRCSAGTGELNITYKEVDTGDGSGPVF